MVPSQPLKQERPGSAAHARTGDEAKQTGTGAMLQASSRASRGDAWLKLERVKGTGAWQEMNEARSPRPLSVTISSVEQIYIKQFLTTKVRQTRLLDRGRAGPGPGRTALGKCPSPRRGEASLCCTPRSGRLASCAAGAFSAQATRLWRSRVCCVSAQRKRWEGAAGSKGEPGPVP